MAPFELSPQHRQTLAALLDAILCRLPEEEERRILDSAAPGTDLGALRAYLRSSASDLGVPQAMEDLLADKSAEEQQQLAGLLGMLSSGFGTLLLCGRYGPFATLSPEVRQRCLHGMRDSMFGAKRQIFYGLQQACNFLAWSRNTAALNPENSGRAACAMWQPLGYEGPDAWEDIEKVTKTAGRDEHLYSMLNSTISGTTELHFDAVIVGSGCGGSVVAAELAQAGYSVLVLEKGTYLRRCELSGEEAQTMKLSESKAQEVSGTCSVVAGSAFGGGSMINWACCLRLPEATRKQWAEEFGLEQFTDGRFEASLNVACERLSVTTEVAHNRANQLLMEGCKKLGYAIGATGQNMADVGPYTPGAGFIAHGCRHGLKQSMPETFLRDAATAARPAQFIDRCYVERVLHDRGVAVGVRARVIGGDGAEHALIVNAPIVVVSGGSLNSPALLLRSGLPNRNKQIGKNLHLHPTNPTAGFMPETSPEVCWWRGAPMTSAHSIPAEDGYGSKLEIPATHLGQITCFLPFRGSQSTKSLMLGAKRLVPVISITRDKASGEVRLGKEGNPIIDYKPNDHLKKAMLEGVGRAVRVLDAMGAERISTLQLPEPRLLPPPTKPEARAAVVEEIIKETQRVGFPAGTVRFFSAHQMSTCRMGTDPKKSVVGPTCESWECSGLFVADASVFPTASGVNPMLTTLAIAHLTAQEVKKSLAARPRGQSALMQPHSRL